MIIHYSTFNGLSVIIDNTLFVSNWWFSSFKTIEDVKIYIEKNTKQCVISIDNIDVIRKHYPNIK